ncbi:VOC family protein [Alkalihalobacillus sp. AL-G]|uniref:VOC family protein n=1 Tax=Alkalihalobacillus sp. AL-G TaxID=2926399 RepID=UPI0027299F89|nr:VOC family protein [Alkalihalobacillus sp. AL-G]WLD92909.1 VOC family protein [Alkalihalobacillus sp. AL-G]
MNFHQSPNTYTGQIHLTVSDFERSLSFYTETLGFKVLEHSERGAVLTADSKTPLITIEQPDHVLPKQPRTTGLFHFAILLPTRGDLGTMIRHIGETGYPLQGASDHLFSEAFYLSDPDGHGIELYADRPESEWVKENGEFPLVSDPLDIDSIVRAGLEKEWNGLPNQTVMGHIHLHVADLEEAKAFYCDGLGFDITIPFRQQALFVSTGGYHHHIGLNTWNGKGSPAPDENHIRMNWFSIILPTEEARNLVITRLEKINVPIIEENGGIWTEDPSRNKIRLELT